MCKSTTTTTTATTVLSRAAVYSKSNECGPGLRNADPKTRRRCFNKETGMFLLFLGGGNRNRDAILCRFPWVRAVSYCSPSPVKGLFLTVSALTDIQRISHAIISYLVASIKPNFSREISQIKIK